MTLSLFYPVLCLVGGAGYCLIEILWRGYTHWSMALAGGMSLLFMGFLCINFPNMSLVSKAAVSAIFITAVEFVFGMVFNVVLKLGVWDYSDEPFNFLGQICPLYSFLWFLLSFAVIFVLEKIIG